MAAFATAKRMPMALATGSALAGETLLQCTVNLMEEDDDFERALELTQFLQSQYLSAVGYARVRQLEGHACFASARGAHYNQPVLVLVPALTTT